MGETLQLETQLSKISRDHLEWLVKKLGRARVSDPVRHGEGGWMVEVVRADGRRWWYFGEIPEFALAKARAGVQAAIDAKKGARRG